LRTEYFGIGEEFEFANNSMCSFKCWSKPFEV